MLELIKRIEVRCERRDMACGFMELDELILEWGVKGTCPFLEMRIARKKKPCSQQFKAIMFSSCWFIMLCGLFSFSGNPNGFPSRSPGLRRIAAPLGPGSCTRFQPQRGCVLKINN